MKYSFLFALLALHAGLDAESKPKKNNVMKIQKDISYGCVRLFDIEYEPRGWLKLGRLGGTLENSCGALVVVRASAEFFDGSRTKIDFDSVEKIVEPGTEYLQIDPDDSKRFRVALGLFTHLSARKLN